MSNGEDDHIKESVSMADLDRLKLKFESWNSDREDFVIWMNSVTAVVRSLRHGDELEDWLDVKLQRVVHQDMMISSIIADDPDFQPPKQSASASKIGEPMDPTTVTRSLFSETPRTVRSIQSLRAANTTMVTPISAGSFYALSDGSQLLDRMLFSVIRNLVKGSKSVLLDCTGIQSYVRGMVLIHSHSNIMRNDRIANAFDAVDSLKFKSDAQEWATSSISAVRELFASRASITHYALTRIMHSLDGKLKTVQYKIAEDLNALQPNDDVNIYDLIQTYATMIASVGDSGSKVLAIEDDLCGYCKEKGHYQRSCPKKQADIAAGTYVPKGKGGNGKGKDSRWKKKCEWCGRKGHSQETCKFKQAQEEKASSINAVQPPDTGQLQSQWNGNNAAHETPTSSPNPPPYAVTQAALAAYLTQLRDGQVQAQRIVRNSTAVARPIRHQIGRNGERIGEASHPGPMKLIIPSNRSSILPILLVSVACVLSLCDGMGCGMMSLTANNATIDRYLAVEISADARDIAKNANDKANGATVIDHSWHSNILNITEQDIADLGHGNIKMFMAGPPCQDFSRLRLITNKKHRRCADELRPGLNGPNGRLFREVIQILQWVLKHNPDCEFLIENVDFSDIKDDWEEICNALGQPILIDAQLYSHTRRNRAYWSNFVSGRDLPPPRPKLDPNVCMVGNRTLIPQLSSDGHSYIRQIGGSWRGDPQHPYASTARPVLVFDPDHSKPQHLYPEEAEQLHGMTPGCTAGRGVTNKQRLEAIGRGWDVNVTNMLLSFSTLSNTGPNQCNALSTIRHMYEYMDPDQMAECLMLLEPGTREWYISLLSTSNLTKSTDACLNDESQIATGIADMTSQPNIMNAESNGMNCDANVIGVASQPNIMNAESNGMNCDANMIDMALQALQCMEPDCLSEVLMAMGPDTRDWYISLLAQQCANAMENSSVLDSGSSRHLQSEVCVTHQDDLTPLSGFNGSMQWTEGNGYVPVHMQDSITGREFKIDFDNVDLMTDGLISNIWSLGKLLRSGWEFHMSDNGKQCYALTPGGAHRIEVTLGLDDILRVHHKGRDGPERVPLPTQPEQSIHTVKRTADSASSMFLHDCFFHRGDEKLYQTLGVTKGYIQAPVKTAHCDSCAKAKARDFGLSQKRVHAVNDHDPVFDDDNQLNADDSEPGSDDELEYIAPLIGRELGEQNVPRFDIGKLQPFEAMFVDNKDFPCAVRGGASTCLVFIDYMTRTKHKVDLHSKANNGRAFKKIVAMEGIHKLPYHCRVYTDGCGSMVHVKDMAISLGIDHQYIPPHQQSLNEAEKVCDSTFAEARTAMDHHNAPDRLFSLMVDYAMYTDIRTATTASRSWKTPYEMTRGTVPFIGKIHRPCTRCFVQVPKSKRRTLASRGLHHLRAEPGRLIGFQGPYSSTYAVLLDKQHKRQPDRVVHSRNVSFNDDDYVFPLSPTMPEKCHAPIDIELQMPAGSEEADTDTYAFNDDRIYSEPAEAEAANENPLFVPKAGTYFDFDDPHNQSWFTHAEPPRQRPRPNYNKMCAVMKEQAIISLVMNVNDQRGIEECTECMQILNTAQPRHCSFNQLSYVMAAQAQSDMDWGKVLESADRDLAIAALEKEMESLLSTILTEVPPNDEEFEMACTLATPGRLLLSVKRSGQYKSRGVKQGFKEDTEQADGPNFNYYAHVAKFTSIRMSTFRMHRWDRRIALKDVSTAFLQSNKYPDGTVKYVSFKDPLTKSWKYYRQSGPLYGEKSATRRWEDTIAPWYESIGYVRGDNEPCAFYDEASDALVLLYTDDNFMDADEEDIKWTSDQLDDRFMCRDIEWLHSGTELDCLGMQLFQSEHFTGYHLQKYIAKTLSILKMGDTKTTCRTPINKDIDRSSAPLTGEQLCLFPTAVGCFGWMSNTCRPDISYAHSRISQHLSQPTVSAWEAVVRCCNYLRGTDDMCIAAPRHQDDKQLGSACDVNSTSCGWEFYSDSDFAGNSEEENNRRSQNGFIALLNGAPVLWGSKVSSVAFAHPLIGEAHPDISSGAAEVYAAGNATFEFLHLSYTADEMGIPFPQPLILQVDNKAAIAFADNSALKTKLKHIDTRQKWVKTLRSKNIIQTKHVPSRDNLADIFTKILDADTFEHLRDRMMHRLTAAQ